MDFVLENEFLKIEIARKGAELKSVVDKNSNFQLLYDGKGEFWSRSSPILFPIVGRLKEDKYLYLEAEYNLSQHGFARDLDFELVDKSASRISFSLKSSEGSFEIYPFDFELIISYELLKNQVIVSFQVNNSGDKLLPFSIGAHPGFNLPIFKEICFNDYYLEFEKNEKLNRHLLKLGTGTFNGKSEMVENSNNCMALNYELFEKDALVFKSLNSQKIHLKCRKSSFNLQFEFENFPYFGIWTKPNATFLCLEPWCGIADNENSDGNLINKEGIVLLESESSFSRSYRFSLES